MPPAVPMKETVDLRLYAALLWRRKWVVIVPTIVAVIAGFVITLPAIMRPIYQCSATLMIEFPQPLSKDVANLVSNPPMEEQIARLQSQIQSSEFLTKLITNTGMRKDPTVLSWAKSSQSKYPELSLDELVDLKLMDYLRGTVQMSSAGGRRGGGNSNIIRIAVMDYYPDRARQLVQNIATGVIEANRSSQLLQMRSAADFSTLQLQEYQTRLKETEAKLEEFSRGRALQQAQPPLVNEATLPAARALRQEAESDVSAQGQGVAAAAQALQSMTGRPAALDPLLETSRARTLRAEARGLEEDYVRQALTEAARPGAGGGGSALQVARKVGDIETGLREAIGADNQFDPSLRDPALTYLMARVRAELARVRLAAFDERIREYLHSVAGSPEAAMEQQRLQQEVESNRALYNAFVQQLVASQVGEAYRASKVGEKISVLEPPALPLEPVKPKRGPLILISVVLGLGVGILGAFLAEHHDQSFRDAREVEAQAGLPVLGAVPNLKALGQQFRVPKKAGGAQQATGMERALREFMDDSPGYLEFRKLVLRLLRSDETGPTTVLITSARTQEGKSVASLCLALTLAKELPKERIVLVDMDTRRPSLAAALGLNGSGPDVRGLLLERKWDDAALHTLLCENLRLLPILGQRGGPTEVVSPESVRWLLGELRQRADRIVIDAPPNLPVPDALIIGPEVDMVLSVVLVGSTPKQAVLRSIELQRQFGNNLKGLLLNNVKAMLPYGYDYRSYGYEYRKNG